MVANLALFSEIANQFTNIRFGDIVKVPVTSTVHFTKCNDLHSITNMRPVGGKYTKVCLFCVFLWFSTLNNQKRTYNAFRIIRQLIIIFVFLRQILRRTMTKLSVNINKIATLRNARGGNVPDVVKVALDCESFGADGITVHPRPDERHIRRSDVYDLRPLLLTEFNIEGIVFSSSCTVYGQPDPENLPVTENAPIKPAMSPYGNTKQINEEIIRDTIHAGAPFKSIILRYFNPIGAHPSAEIGELPNGVPQNLIPYLTQTAMGIRKELSVFGDDYDTADGSCIRDYINVVDLAKAHVIAMDRMLENKSDEHIEIFNLGTGNGVSVLELINTFEQTTGVKVPHKIVGRREGDIEKVWANPEHANKVLGWTAKETLADTLPVNNTKKRPYLIALS